MLKKFGNSFFWIQHVQIRLEHISKHFYQKMPSQVTFSGFPASKQHHQETEERSEMVRRRSFDFAVGHIWNSLPLDRRKCEKFDIFKKDLKMHLFKIFYKAFMT